MVLRCCGDQRQANLVNDGDFGRRWQSGEHQHATAVVTAARNTITGLVVVTMVVM
jgi:hypothetical protein